jgi:homoserine kinase
MSKQVSIRVPATSANLGCLFDCAALAVGLYLDLHVTARGDEQVSVRYQGVNPDRIPLDETNLIVRTMKATLCGWGKQCGFDLEIHNQIPVGAGLGSSAAALVAALAACYGLRDRALLDEDLISQAARLEGHPDNVAAAWLGGFAISAQKDERVVSWSCPVPDELQLVVVVPDYPLSTEKARQALPDSYSRADAIHNLQRAVLIATAFSSGRADLQPFLFQDRWHQPFRASLIPGLPDVLALKTPGLLGVCLSGAGPSVLALTREKGFNTGEAIRQILHQHGVSSQVFLLSPDNKGAKGWNVPR